MTKIRSYYSTKVLSELKAYPARSHFSTEVLPQLHRYTTCRGCGELSPRIRLTGYSHMYCRRACWMLEFEYNVTHGWPCDCSPGKQRCAYCD